MSGYLRAACGCAVVLCNRCCRLRIHQRLKSAQSGCLAASSQGACSLSARQSCHIDLQQTLLSYSLLINPSGSLLFCWLLQSALSGGKSPLQLLTERGGADLALAFNLSLLLGNPTAECS